METYTLPNGAKVYNDSAIGFAIGGRNIAERISAVLPDATEISVWNDRKGWEATIRKGDSPWERVYERDLDSLERQHDQRDAHPAPQRDAGQPAHAHHDAEHVHAHRFDGAQSNGGYGASALYEDGGADIKHQSVTTPNSAERTEALDAEFTELEAGRDGEEILLVPANKEGTLYMSEGEARRYDQGQSLGY